MQIVYYAHSYRDKDINDFFQDLMLSEGLMPSLDPPSESGRLNSAKPERHLRSTDGMIAVVPYRQPEPSPYILYEIGLCIRARKPLLIFVEDVLPDDLVRASLLQRRFSRQHLLRELRSHRDALRQFKTYIGKNPPPAYQPSIGQRSCCLIGSAGCSEDQAQILVAQLTSLRYASSIAPNTGDWFAPSSELDRFVSHSNLCVSFVEGLSSSEFYLLGLLRGALVPTVLLTQNRDYVFNPQIPTEYQPRIVSCANSDSICETVRTEIAIFEEDYLDIQDQERVVRYRAALIQEGTDGSYSKRTRDMVVNIVAQNAGGIDLSKDKIEVSHVVGPVNIKSRLDNVTQTVRNAQSLPNEKRDELAQLLADLKVALEPVDSARQSDAERVVRTAELVATEVARPKPDKGFLDISVDGLKKAAKAVEDIAPAVLHVAASIAAFISGIST